MMPYLSALIILLLSINFLLGFPKVVDLAQAKVSAFNVTKDPTNSSNFSQVAGVEKENLPPEDQGQPVPIVSASGVIVKDLDSGGDLYVKDPDKRVPIASTTKIMTAVVAIEYFKANDILVVPDNIGNISGSTMNLKPGEKLTFRSLLYGMLLNSGNDAAFTIAANTSGGVSGFVEKMNQKVKEMGLLNTNFENPAGFDSPSHFSSAFDLAKIAVLLSENPQLSRVVATKETSVASIDKSVIHSLKNLNKLLDEPGVLGIKTGTTPAAKENLVGLIDKNNHRILTVVLGSNDRFGETEKLMDWVYTNFVWQ